MKILYSIGILLLAVCFSACSSEESYDVTGNPNNLYYILNRNWSTVNGERNSYQFEITHTPAGLKYEVPTIKSPIRSTRPAKSSVRVSAKHDSSLVEKYNSSKNTAYAACPDNVVDLVKSSVVFDTGSSISRDSLEITLSQENVAALTEPAYLIPITLSDTPEGAAASELDVIWLVLNTKYTNIKEISSTNEMNGFAFSNYNGWKVESESGSEDASQIFDRSTDTYMILGETPATIVVDMMKEKTVSGFMFVGRLRNGSLRLPIDEVEVWTSDDNSTWVSQGKGGLLTANSYEQYVSFYEAVKARYIKLTLTWPRNMNGTYYSLSSMRVYTTDTEEIVHVTGVTLDKDRLAFTGVGESATLTPTILPEYASDLRVTWKSSNENVATVDANGKVTAAGAGEATITVSTVDGAKTAQCTVKVVIVKNLLSNPGFEAGLTQLGSGKYKDGVVWNVYTVDKKLNWGENPPMSTIRSSNPQYVSEGTYSLIMHSDSRYLTQKISGGNLKPNTKYRITYDYFTSSSASVNGGGVYDMYLGKQEFANDILQMEAHTLSRTTAGKMTFSKTFTTPASVPETVWFTLFLSDRGNTSTVDWLDNMSLKEVIE